MNIRNFDLVKEVKMRTKEYFCTPAGNHHDGASRRNSCNQL
jgi:hypothetical protein